MPWLLKFRRVDEGREVKNRDPSPNSASDELRERLREALRPTTKEKPSIEESAKELKAVRLRCHELGFDYPKLLTEVCQALSAERKTDDPCCD